MANRGLTYSKDDEYNTPKWAWEHIKEYIPRDKVIWEAFYGDGQSGNHLTELGFNVIHENIDFFENNLGDIVVSNPPFTKTKEVLQRLVNEIDKPFILILPSGKITTQYFKIIFKEKEHLLQIIIPPKRIQFIKEGQETNRCSFDCFYYCYKMNLPRSIIL